MSVLVLHAEVVEKSLKLTGVLLGAIGIGSACGVTLGFLDKRPREQIEMWGFAGTAIGSLVGFLLMLCAWIVLDQS
jgi:hypothetical protein